MTAQDWLRYHCLVRWRERVATVEPYLGPPGEEFRKMNARRQEERLARADAQLKAMSPTHD